MFVVSDSGSFSSNHSSFRRSQKTSYDMRPLSEKCNGTVVSEEMNILDESEVLVGDIVDGNDDVTEEAHTEEPTTGIDVVSLDEDGAATDEEDEIEDTMRSFEDPPNAENERRDRDSLRIDDSDVLPCRTGNAFHDSIKFHEFQVKHFIDLIADNILNQLMRLVFHTFPDLHVEE